MPGPAACFLDERQGLFIVVIDQHAFLGKLGFTDKRQAAFRSTFFIAVRRVHQDRQIKTPGQLQLQGKIFIFGGRDLIVTDLAYRYDRVLERYRGSNSKTPSATRGSLASLGLSDNAQKWRMPNWLARKGSHPNRA